MTRLRRILLFLNSLANLNEGLFSSCKILNLLWQNIMLLGEFNYRKCANIEQIISIHLFKLTVRERMIGWVVEGTASKVALSGVTHVRSPGKESIFPTIKKRDRTIDIKLKKLLVGLAQCDQKKIAKCL